ncbi:transketolase [Candidatus Riesia sp. GBBU]|nr:transketolase [Candidatus Riesia sp. GBBU]
MTQNRSLSNAIRFLSVDAIQKSGSGHPGMPMGMADIAEVLWRKYLVHNPKDPSWINRDRFVLSNGHGSMLLYSLLHLTGYDLSIKEIKKFRKMNSKTPGHPEYGLTEGVETTTGLLGQGIANAVGFAISEKILASQFNKSNYNIIDHYTYVFVGDGCMMEGISHEVCSLAGTLKLGKLIVFYDSNGISIDGKVEGWFNEDTAKRFESYHWNVINNIDGHDHEKINNSIKKARLVKDKPSLLIFNTIIGYGSPNKSGSEKIHGNPLGEKEIEKTRKALKWNYDVFSIPDKIYKKWNACRIGEKRQNKWNKKFCEYKKIFPKLASELLRRKNQRLPKNWNREISKFIKDLNYKISYKISGRQASSNVLEKLSDLLPEILGGSSDVTQSTLSMFSRYKPCHINTSGNYIHYGAREFGMSSIINGISLYKGLIPYGSTFLAFSEYSKSAIRMASLMKIRAIFIYTHDSILIGEDGPTHQPIEQLSCLRMIPNINVWRPCDQIETVCAWKYMIERKDGPGILILSRQDLMQQKRDLYQIKNIIKGAYILKENSPNPSLILIATGSEVELAVSAYSKLCEEGYNVRIISMPSIDLFEKQNKKYKDFLLPPYIKSRVVIEAGSKDFWYKYVGRNGKVIGINRFGKSSSPKDLYKTFGFNLKNILNISKLIIKKNKNSL